MCASLNSILNSRAGRAAREWLVKKETSINGGKVGCHRRVGFRCLSAAVAVALEAQEACRVLDCLLYEVEAPDGLAGDEPAAGGPVDDKPVGDGLADGGSADEGLE